MALSINTNVLSLNAQRNLSTSASDLATSLQRLSSGLRINSARDDAAGLAISERFTTQIRGLAQAARNANDGISLAQTTEGALAELTNNLQRIRELAVQAANASNSGTDRAALDQEVQQRLAEVDRIATVTAFNGQKVLDGSFGTAVFQVGANVGETISINLNTSAKTSALGSYVNRASNHATVLAPSVAASTGTYTAVTLNHTGVDTNQIVASTLALNGVSIKDSSLYAGASASQDLTSAYAKAAAINASGISGVSATASNTITLAAVGGSAPGVSDFLKLSTSAGTATLGYEMQINGQAVLNASGNTSIDTAVQAINAWSTTTGVIASKTSAGGLQLYAADGRNISIKETINTGGAGAGNTSTTASLFGSNLSGDNAVTARTQTMLYTGQLTLNSSSSVAVTPSGGGNATNIGLTAGTTVLTGTGSLTSVNVTTVANANSAILSVDAALTSVSTLRSSLGSMQSRFESTITSLQNATENLSASRSRILDTDFAAETANLTRAQILQQAGTAILAQANAAPQSVLSLLK